MPAANTPAAEVPIDEGLVRGLLEDQHPDLAGLPLRAFASGWDNAIYRLGEDLGVRLPRRQMAAALVAHEQQWLPRLAPSLPLPIPVPLRAGRPGRGFPWTWSICRWFPGEVAAASRSLDLAAAAGDLGRFLAALHRPAPADAPKNVFRGGALPPRSEPLEERLEQLAGRVDGASIRARWSEWLTTPPWSGVPLWLHGDLHPANLVVREGRLAAVLDFGDITAGDPATDLSVAWMIFPPDLRSVFRTAVGGVDDATWARARAWALSLAVAFLANSADAPLLEQIGQRTLERVLDDA